ncbi:BRD4-interacting chromatin-remodeling complex-associated protein isoform X2 [Vombatus ursinus]|uniref:BRD4-interacting chromatin-remodeling complex-associated protein isoform X2 n=1 Tax=Vombatus ursinus TaxID=29139 RepID=UPI000FFDB4F9|nr:BRD4-interacting chromatin-remodeling complex-associated protein isoform X2 [Vombatus ursinus]
MDDEDGRCLLDVICDPQALNDFLHGSEKIDSDDLLDNTGEATSAFFEGAGLHVQEAPGNHLNPEPSQPATSVDLDFLEDDILGSPSAGGGGGGGGSGGAEQPCDILQQSLQEANITEQTLEAEAELDLGPFQLPALQPADDGGGAGGAAAAAGAQALFPGGADLLGLQPPAVLTHQALVRPPDVVNVNKALGVQPFLQPVGLGNVTLQPIPGLQGLPNGSPGGAAAAALGLAPIQVVGQSVMALNPPAPQLLAKQVPVGGYLAPAAPAEPGPVTLASAGVSPQGAGLVIQKNLSAAVATTLNGNSVFAGGGVPGTAAAGGAAGPGGQPLAVASGLGASSLVPAPNVILHRTPTPIQPKPAGVLPPKLYQLTPKPFGTAGATLTIQGEAGGLPQPPKAPSNLTFMAAGKAGQNVVLSGFPPSLPANVFKPPPATAGSTPGTSAAPPPGTLSKPMSVHLLNQGGSIVIPAQHMLQGQNQFLLPGAPTVQLPQPISALPANVGGQILAAAAAAPHAGGQLIANPILTNQNLAGPLSLGSVLAPHAGGHGAAHILSAAPIQVGQPTLFQMPVSLAASSLPTQSQPAPAGPTATATVLQGVTLPPSAVAMLNAAEGLVQSAAAPAGGETASVLTVQAAPQAPPAAAAVPPVTPLPLGLPQQPPPPTPTQPPTPQPSPSLASSPEKIVLGQPATTTAVITQESMQMFLPQERSQQSPYLPLPMEGAHLSLPLPAYSVAGSAPSTSSSAPASVIVSSGAGQPQARDPAPGTPDTKGAGLIPQFPTSQTPPALTPQISAAQQKVPGASSSPSLPHPPPLGDSPHLPSPHPARPPSRPPSRPHSRPPSQPQSVSRPPSEPPLHPCPPPQPLPGLFVIQNPLGPSSHGAPTPAPAAAPTPPLRPPSQPPEGPAPPPPHLQAQLATTTSDATSRMPASAPPDAPHSNSPHFQLQFAPSQVPLKPPTPTPAVHLASEPPPQPPAPPPPRTFQMVPNPFQALATPAAQSKPLLERFHQVPSGLILQGKAAGPPATQQTPQTLGPLASPAPSILVSGQAPPGAQATSSHPPAPAASTDSKVFGSSVPALGGAKAGTGQGKTSGPSPGQVVAMSPGPSLGLPKGPLQIQVVGKGLPELRPSPPVQYESKMSSLKKPATVQPSKEACFLEHLHRHQGSVLHPDYKTAFPSFEDALRRLLPYHVYQGALPSPHDHRRVDEEFETVSTQLLRRTQAMLNKYRLLLLEESRRVSPSAEMVMIDRMFIQEEKTTLALDKQLAKEKPDEYVSSRPHGLPVLGSESHGAHRLSCTPAHPPLSSSSSGAPTQLPPHPPTKLVIRHGGAGGSPSVTWARPSSSSSSSSSSSAASSLDADEDTPLPSRSRPPIKTYEARSRIGLKLKIKQEAGLSKVVHNTALDPVHHPSPGPKGTEPPAPALASSGQMNGTVEHPPAPPDRKPAPPTSQCPRLPLRKTYRENVDAFSSCRAGAPRAAAGGSPAPAPLVKSDDTTSGLIRELAEVEDELYQRVMKAAPLEVVTAGTGAGAGPAWEAPPLPPAKRRKSESPDMDNASFSSDSPQDDSLTEHLQSAIDSILNLQQAAPQPSGRTAGGASHPHPAASPPLHRPDGYLGPSHNGGLGARTLNR